MNSQIQRFLDTVRPRAQSAEYETLNESPDKSEPGSDLESVSSTEIHRRSVIESSVQRTLARLKLAVVLLASLLVSVSVTWAGKEFRTERVLVTHESYSNTAENIEYSFRGTPEVFSPADEAVVWKPVVFHNNFHEDRTPWQGPPNDEVDKAWDSLYRGIGIIKIPKVDAERLPNRTLPIPGEDDGYITGLEVYHQLHCLDFIRRALYPGRYGGDTGMSEKKRKEYWVHLDHCVDNLRQTIMCYSDISTIPWKVNDRVHREFPDAHTTHICRDFDKLTEWMLHPDRHFPQEKYQLRLEAFHAGASGGHAH